MKVLICGAGLVGMNIASYLARGGNDVTVIDQRPELTQQLAESLDIQGITGFASEPDVLNRAGAEDADMLIAVTQTDEINMIACQIAHSLFGVPTKIARVRRQSYLEPRWQDLFSRDHLPIDVVISPEVEVARAIHRRLDVVGALDATPFVDDKVRLMAVRCEPDCPVLDTPLRQLTYLFPDLHITIVAIHRDDATFMPSGDDQLLVGDEVHFIVDTAHVARAMHALGYEDEPAERVLIAGGGNIGFYLAAMLEETRAPGSIKVIETNPTRAHRLAEDLRRTLVLQGDARDLDLLAEAGASGADAMVTVTNDDEVNVMASLLAKHVGCRRAFALVNHASYRSLIGSLGIDVAINPRETTVSSVLQHTRRGRIKAVRSIRDGAAEVYEAEVLETSQLAGRSLREAKLPKDLLVGAVVHGDQVMIARGDTVIRPHDRVVLATGAAGAKHVEKLFAVRVDYF